MSSKQACFNDPGAWRGLFPKRDAGRDGDDQLVQGGGGLSLHRPA